MRLIKPKSLVPLAKVLLAFLCICALTLGSAIANAGKYSTKYDSLIQKYSKRYLVGQDSDLLKAQLIQESSLNPNAVSPVGAQGLGQIMPATYMDICQALLTCHKSVFDPEINIMAAAFYQARQEAAWHWERPFADKKALGLAAYNSGLGNLIEAQKACDMAKRYQCIVDCLPMITKHHSKETIGYVKRIAAIYAELKRGA